MALPQRRRVVQECIRSEEMTDLRKSEFWVCRHFSSLDVGEEFLSRKERHVKRGDRSALIEKTGVTRIFSPKTVVAAHPEE